MPKTIGRPVLSTVTSSSDIQELLSLTHTYAHIHTFSLIRSLKTIQRCEDRQIASSHGRECEIILAYKTALEMSAFVASYDAFMSWEVIHTNEFKRNNFFNISQSYKFTEKFI